MKAVGIVGSPRTNGNSAYVTQELLNLLSRKFQTECIQLSGLDLHPCNACHTCVQEGNCIIDDDMQAVYTTLKESAVIILSSPVHMGGITSRLRMFMERTWPLRKGALEGKIGSYIVLGRRDLGAAVHEMDEYLSRIKAVTLPGIIGYGFHKGEITQDTEATKNIVRLANQILEISSKIFV